MSRNGSYTHMSSSQATGDLYANGIPSTKENGSPPPGDSGYAGLEPIAIIGMDLKFPGDASNAEGFFEMLKQGRSALSEVPKDRYNLKAFYHPDQERQGL